MPYPRATFYLLTQRKRRYVKPHRKDPASLLLALCQDAARIGRGGDTSELGGPREQDLPSHMARKRTKRDTWKKVLITPVCIIISNLAVTISVMIQQQATMGLVSLKRMASAARMLQATPYG